MTSCPSETPPLSVSGSFGFVWWVLTSSPSLSPSPSLSGLSGLVSCTLTSSPSFKPSSSLSGLFGSVFVCVNSSSFVSPSLSKSASGSLRGSIFGSTGSVFFLSSEARFGSVPWLTSCPSLTPPPSESGLLGSVLWVKISTPSKSPSPSLSLLAGSVPFSSSNEFGSPSPSSSADSPLTVSYTHLTLPTNREV